MSDIYVRSRLIAPEELWSRWDLLESGLSEGTARERLKEYRDSAKRDSIPKQFKIER